MTVRHTAAATLCVAAFLHTPAQAADSADLQRMQQQIDQLKQSYEGRIQALEAKLRELQQQSPTAANAGAPPLPASNTAAASGAAAPPAANAQPAANAPPVAAAPAAPIEGQGLAPAATAQAAASAFNPAISLILTGTYANLQRDPDQYRLQGFIPSGGEAGPGPRGFNLGESELSIAANIDPTFSGHLTASITSDNQIAIEEAVFERQAIFPGATLKGGRFLSSIGYLNSQHSHVWDFVDAPLVYQAMFGGQLQTDGLQLRWLAPTERFVELGAEIGAGRSFPGSQRQGNGIGSTALLAHVGDDIGDSASWRAGVSYLLNRATDRQYDDTDAAGAQVTNAFSGTSRTWALDGIYKWAPGGNATRNAFKLQGEYFRRIENGSLAYDLAGADASGSYRAAQSGWYLQAVYQFMPQWRAGLRYDRLDSGSPRIGLVDSGALSAADFPILQGARPSRSTVMVDYTLSEFSRFRLQLANDRSNPTRSDRQIFLQYIMSLGAHGAHTF